MIRGCDFLFFRKWRINPEDSVIFPSERKITMADFGKLKEMGAACIWTKRGLCSSNCWLVFFGEEKEFEEFYKEMRLPFWMRKREFYSVRSCCLKGSRKRVLRA